jgi:hypothetical protein
LSESSASFLQAGKTNSVARFASTNSALAPYQAFPIMRLSVFLRQNPFDLLQIIDN